MVREAHEQQVRSPRRRVRYAGGLVGAGSALLFEDIVLRGLLAWHTLATPTPPLWMEAGLRFLFVALGLGGVVALYRARVRLLEPASGRVLLGSVLAGAGALALVEGVLMHHVLAIHAAHAGDAATTVNVAYLLVALALAAAGTRLLVTASRLRQTGTSKRRTRGDADRSS